MMQSTLFRLALICFSPTKNKLFQQLCDQEMTSNTRLPAFSKASETTLYSQCKAEAVTFSHVSGEPVSHFPSAKVENGSELVDMTECLVQFHAIYPNIYPQSFICFNRTLTLTQLDALNRHVSHCLHPDSNLPSSFFCSGMKTTSSTFFRFV